MVITKQYVVLNFPKTGSTFIRKCIEQIHGKKYLNLGRFGSFVMWIWYRIPFAPLPDYVSILTFLKQGRHWVTPHGGMQQVPQRFKGLPMVMAVRNPLDRYVSQYQFGLWKKAGNPQVKKHFKAFPDLNFNDFIEYKKAVAHNRPEAREALEDIGHITIRFALMIAKHPCEFISLLDDQFVDSGEFKKHIGNLTLIDQKNLNEGLYSFLKQYHNEEELSFINDLGRIQPKHGTTRTEWDDFGGFYDQETRKKILHEERLYRKMCQQLGVEFDL